MSRWSEEFEKLDIHKTLSDTLKLLSTLELPSTKVENIDVDFAAEFAAEFANEKRRLTKVISMIDEAVKGIDAECFPLVFFDHTDTTLVQIYNSLKDCPNEDSAQLVGKLTEANDNLTDIMAIILKLPGLARSVEVKEVIKGTEAAFEKFTKHMDDSADSFKKKITELEALSPRLDEWRKKYDDKLKEAVENFNVSVETIQTDINDKHNDIIDLHGLVAVDSVAGGYKKNADDEKRQASLWRRITIVALISAAIFPAFKFFGWFKPLEGDTSNWPEIITAASLISIFLGIAAYTSKQSKMHRDNERISRSFALETQALDPFMSSLDPAAQQQIKVELIQKMFGQQYRETNDEDTTVVNALLRTN